MMTPRLAAVLGAATAVGALLVPAMPAPAATAVRALVVPASAASYSWCTTDRFGIRTWPGGQITYNNEWNSSSPQRMCANSPADVQVIARQRATGRARSCPAVLSYPAVQYNFPGHGTPASKLHTVHSTYAESQPSYPRGIGEFASDDYWWLPGGTREQYEVMSWEDNQGQSPGGTYQAKYGIIHLAGHYYKLWDGFASTGQGYFVFLRTGKSGHPVSATQGYIPHLAEAKWLIAHHLMRADSLFRQEEIGWEICTDPRGGGIYRITVNRLAVK
jgi:hypothetical protein